MDFCLNASAFTLRVKSSGDCSVLGLLIDGDISADSSINSAKGCFQYLSHQNHDRGN